ncbi:MAG: ectonucleotide pyrophosphatase/phosphodiesterase [Bradymonadaceae bacterium]
MQRFFFILATLLVFCLVGVGCSDPNPGQDVITIEERDVPEPFDPGPRKPLLLVGIDGFKTEYLDLIPTPNFDAIIAEGVLADSMIPVFPSKTMVNLYSIVTGLYPENSGILSNSMYDAEIDAEFRMFGDAMSDSHWWEGEPIWVTAENQDVRTGTVFWVGSEALIKGVQPTHWVPYDSRIGHQLRVDRALEWLTLDDDTRPEFVTLYFSRPDNVGHEHGPDSQNIRGAIQAMDDTLGYLMRRLKEAGLWDEMNIVFVSDHGMTNTDEDHVIMLDEIITLTDVRMIEWTPVAMIQPRVGRLDSVYNQLKAAENNYRVYKRDDLPEHYRLKNHHRVPDIVIVADLPYTITNANFLASNGVFAGNHGYDPREPDMHAFFMARGPDFKAGERPETVELIDLYEMMAYLLRIDPAPNDGSFDGISSILDMER